LRKGLAFGETRDVAFRRMRESFDGWPQFISMASWLRFAAGFDIVFGRRRRRSVDGYRTSAGIERDNMTM
jgi:hypothetical protein